jgi:pimeloyl-ACP methyl ester carboxylesterase
MNLKRTAALVFSVTLAAAAVPVAGQSKVDLTKAAPPASIPTFSTADIARIGYFYAGGKYVASPSKEGDHYMQGAMYTEVWVPKEIRHPYPLVLFGGQGQLGTVWEQTPDGRPGWAYYLVKQGYVLYLTDYPGRGRSPHVPGVDGPLSMRSMNDLESQFTNVKEKSDFPLKDNHTQWPGTGKMGDPYFDAFAKGQAQSTGGPMQAGIYRDAAVALLDMIGSPVILLPHSMGGGVAWAAADARPNMVKAIVMVETNGINARTPLTYNPPVTTPDDIKTVVEAKSDGPGELPCTLQAEPARQLVNLKGIPMVYYSGNGGYHRRSDSCVPKWFNQAGVKMEYVRLEDVGQNGNGHEMFFEKNSVEIIKLLDEWMRRNVK